MESTTQTRERILLDKPNLMIRAEGDGALYLTGIRNTMFLHPDEETARKLVELIGPPDETELGVAANFTWLADGLRLSVFTSPDLVRELDPMTEVRARYRKILAAAVRKESTVPLYRPTPIGEDSDVEPDEGEARQTGRFAGMGDTGRFDVFRPDGEQLDYPSLDELIGDGWIPD